MRSIKTLMPKMPKQENIFTVIMCLLMLQSSYIAIKDPAFHDSYAQIVIQAIFFMTGKKK